MARSGLEIMMQSMGVPSLDELKQQADLAMGFVRQIGAALKDIHEMQLVQDQKLDRIIAQNNSILERVESLERRCDRTDSAGTGATEHHSNSGPKCAICGATGNHYCGGSASLGSIGG